MELSYCAPLGIPLSDFRSWHDDDRRWALAYAYDEASKLACGCYPDETTGIENDDVFVAKPLTCHRHRAIGLASEHRQKNATAADSSYGVLWRTERVDY